MSSGRHRADPKGHNRFFVGALGVFAVLLLVGVGGFSLYGILKPPETNVPEGKVAANVEPPTKVEQTPAQRSRAQDSPSGLVIRVTGAKSWVEVSDSGGEQLLSAILKQGDTRQFDGEEFEVQLGNADAVDVTVDGEPYDDGSGVSTFTINR